MLVREQLKAFARRGSLTSRMRGSMKPRRSSGVTRRTVLTSALAAPAAAQTRTPRVGEIHVTRTKRSSRRVFDGWNLAVILLPLVLHAQGSYTTYGTFDEVLQGSGARYPALIRVSDPRAAGKPAYTGFFFYQCLQFDTSKRYLLAMKVYFQNRLVQSSESGRHRFCRSEESVRMDQDRRVNGV